MSTLNFSISSGILTWGATHYTATSGPHGKGALPLGGYTIKVRHTVVGNHLASGFKDNMTGNSWFIPLDPVFSTTRSGFGIHPDGNIPGTLGCVGLTGIDAGNFWTLWNNTPLAARPTTLTVTA